MKSGNTKKIILSGGGSGGSVSPLLAIVDEIRANPEESRKKFRGDIEFVWVGTRKGMEKQMVEKENIPFKAIFSGKLRRYFSWQNFLDLFSISLGFIQSLFIIIKFKPNLIMTAGSFVSVPLVWAARFMDIPVMVHQQDVVPGLANKLMAHSAQVVTATLEKSLADYGEKAKLVGNPVRQSFKKQRFNRAEALRNFNLNDILPIVLIVGGGTGSRAINSVTFECLDKLVKFYQVVHVIGKGRGEWMKRAGYQAFDFLSIDRMVEILNLADVVVSRCGISTLTELSYLGKPSILIPMLDSHQEANAQVFQEKNAALVVNEKDLNAKIFMENIEKIINNEKLWNDLSENIKTVIKKDAEKEIIDLMVKTLK